VIRIDLVASSLHRRGMLVSLRSSSASKIIKPLLYLLLNSSASVARFMRGIIAKKQVMIEFKITLKSFKLMILWFPGNDHCTDPRAFEDHSS
jgi:hypothetical protein